MLGTDDEFMDLSDIVSLLASIKTQIHHFFWDELNIDVRTNRIVTGKAPYGQSGYQPLGQILKWFEDAHLLMSYSTIVNRRDIFCRGTKDALCEGHKLNND